ncbi:MAG: hypothetical protein AAFO93_05495 [Pseudomonadota bacterium]
MQKIVIHAGFHKTATTTVQRFLGANRDALRPMAKVVLAFQLRHATAAAHVMSNAPSAAHLADFRSAFEDVLRVMPRDRNIILSSEDLIGRVPGRVPGDAYPQAEHLAKAMMMSISRVFSDECEATLILSRRAPEDWIESVWWQNLRSTRMTLSHAAFRESMGSGDPQQGVVDRMQAHLGAARVQDYDIERTASIPGGAAWPLLHMIDIPDAIIRDLTPVSPQNRRTVQGLEDVFLALNRSDLSKAGVMNAKTLILRSARRQAPE